MAPESRSLLRHSGQLTDGGLEKRLSSGLPNRLFVIFSSIWHRARRGVCQSAFNLFDREPKGRIIVNSALNQIEGMDHGRMVAAEMLADVGKRGAGHLTAEIHRDLPAERHTLRALLRLELRQANMKPIRNDPLNSFDVGFAFIGLNQISEGLARKLDCNRRPGN